MTELRTKLVAGAFEVLRSPRVTAFLRRRKVVDVVVSGLSVHALSRMSLRRVGTSMARALGLATLEDLRHVEAAVDRRATKVGAASAAQDSVSTEPRRT